MNPNLERGILLYQQSRHEMAEAELRQALAVDPLDAYAHSLLALCLTEREQFKDATAEAQKAVHLGPDFPFAHYALARVYYVRNHHQEAQTAVEEAIRLDPTDAGNFSLLAAIHLDEGRWVQALGSAEQGLQCDPEHVRCTNLRAISLVKLGRKAEAGATIDAALSKDPDNSLTHANQGWTLLEKGEPKRALEHFRESLRLDPGNEWARRGIVEALKARNIIYAVMLKYFLWMSRLSRRAQWGVVLGGYLGSRILSGLAQTSPLLEKWILPVQIVYLVFVLMTWLAYPLFNLLLRLNRFGRMVLSREQIVASNWVGSFILLALIGLTGAFVFTPQGPWLLLAGFCGLLILPVAGIFKCARGWPRAVMAVYTAALALAGLAAMVLFVIVAIHPENDQALTNPGIVLFGAMIFGVIASTWIANILVHQRPRR